MNNPNTGSPVRSKEVEDAVVWLNDEAALAAKSPFNIERGYLGHAAHLLAYIAQLEASQPKRISGPTSEIYEAFKASQPAVTSGAVEASVTIGDEALATAKRIDHEVVTFSKASGSRHYNPLLAAAIIQQAMDGARAAVFMNENGSPEENTPIAVPGTKTRVVKVYPLPPAADGKLREALVEIWNKCRFVVKHGDDLGRHNTLCMISDICRQALAQPASGGGVCK